MLMDSGSSNFNNIVSIIYGSATVSAAEPAANYPMSIGSGGNLVSSGSVGGILTANGLFQCGDFSQGLLGLAFKSLMAGGLLVFLNFCLR